MGWMGPYRGSLPSMHLPQPERKTRAVRQRIQHRNTPESRSRPLDQIDQPHFSKLIRCEATQVCLEQAHARAVRRQIGCRCNMRVAVVGAGISGLVVAHSLHQQHEITVFEAADRIGGHTNTVVVPATGREWAIDTGFIVYNDRTYPNFCQIIDELGVSWQPTEMSFSVRCDCTGQEYQGSSWNGLFAQRSNLWRPRFYRLIRDIVRFNREWRSLADNTSHTETVSTFLERCGVGREFVEQYFVPMGSAIWSCPPGTFGEFPVRFVLDFYDNHGLLQLRDRPQWRVIEGGSRTYVEALTRPFASQLHTQCPVTHIDRDNQRIRLETPRGNQEFDHVVFACHSDQALSILGSAATEQEREILGAFPYETSSAVLHTDTRLLPRRRRAWASWNYLRLPDRLDKAVVTYNMNILQHIKSDVEFCVTLNADDLIAAEHVLYRTTYQHPVYTQNRQAAQARHSELINRHRTSFCGAYWGNGFHEDGVRSALAVSRRLAHVDTNRLGS